MASVEVQQIDPVFRCAPSKDGPWYTKKLEVVAFGDNGEDVLVCFGGVEAIEP